MHPEVCTWLVEQMLVPDFPKGGGCGPLLAQDVGLAEDGGWM